MLTLKFSRKLESLLRNIAVTSGSLDVLLVLRLFLLFVSEETLRQDPDLFLQLLSGEEEPPHHIVQLLQSQLSMNHRDLVRV